MNKRKIGWKRVGECKFCGQARCVVNVDNEKMGHCFRYGKTFFSDGKGNCHFSEGKKRISKKRKLKTNKNQVAFDFGESFNMYDHEQ